MKPTRYGLLWLVTIAALILGAWAMFTSAQAEVALHRDCPMHRCLVEEL